MPDRRGKPLRAGDKIVFHSNMGYVFGELKYDEDEKPTYHIFASETRPVRKNDSYEYEPTTNLKYYPKWPNGILNMTAWAEDILDAGKVDLPEPI